MSNGRFKDKVVMVTGSGRGFGAVLADAYAREGADLIIHYNSSADGAEAVAKAVRAMGRRALVVKGDISKLADVIHLTEAAFKEFGRVDILVNNVGDMALDQVSWREMDEKVVDHTLAVDIKGTMFMIHEVGKRMMDLDGGVIVNIGSQVVIAGSPRAPTICGRQIWRNWPDQVLRTRPCPKGSGQHSGGRLHGNRGTQEPPRLEERPARRGAAPDAAGSNRNARGHGRPDLVLVRRGVASHDRPVPALQRRSGDGWRLNPR
jgi:NAD(P)-dependent dehydrogenase (short-subunit alcohol dehydrogenase family)